MNIHIGLDLSFNSTGMVIYYSDETRNIRNIEFHRIVKSGANKSSIQLININYHIVNVDLLGVELDMQYPTDMYTNGVEYSNEQILITEQYFLIVNKIVTIIRKSISDTLIKYQLKPEDISLYVNMEGSLLSGYNFNSQIGLNMLQGYLRAELIKLQLKNKFSLFKQRIIPPTLLKSFFADDGKAEKISMIRSFIENYNGRKLIPQISLSNRMIEILNDIIDAFALVAFNIYDISMMNKDLFNIKKLSSDNKKLIRKKQKVKRRNVMDMSKFIPDNNKPEVNTSISKQETNPLNYL